MPTLNFMHLAYRFVAGEGGCIYFIDWGPGAYLVYQLEGGRRLVDLLMGSSRGVGRGIMD